MGEASYLRGPMETTPALEAAFNAIDDSIGPDADDAQQLIAAKCRGLMYGYDARWANAGWETLSVEKVFHLPVINPETGHPSRSFTHAGKYDGIIAYEGRPYLLEHKTCSEEIADVDAPYWKRLTIDSQVSGYVLANWQDGQKMTGNALRRHSQAGDSAEEGQQGRPEDAR